MAIHSRNSGEFEAYTCIEHRPDTYGTYTMFPWPAVQLPNRTQTPPVDNEKGAKIKAKQTCSFFHSFSASNMDGSEERGSNKAFANTLCFDLFVDFLIFLDRWGFHGTVAAAICFFEGCLPVRLS